MAGDSEPSFVLYRYTPSIVAAVIFVILFAAASFAHLFYVVKLRARYFIPFVIGGLFECTGYVGRALSNSNKDALGPYILQSVLILVAPALFAASIYMILSRIIKLLDAEEYSMIRTKRLTKIFVCGDVFSFLVQSNGAGLQAQGHLNTYNIGKDIIIVGLIMQMVIFAFFVVVAGIFHLRLVRMPTSRSLHHNLPWQKHMYNLYFTSAIILIRNLVRVVEYAQGNDGFIVSHEAMMYVFDASLMFIVMVAFLVVHPNKLLGTGGFTPALIGEPELYAMETGNTSPPSSSAYKANRS